MELLTTIAKHHKEWIRIVTSFGCEYPEDVVQEVYLRINKYGKKDKFIIEGEVNRFLMWMILRNAWHDSNKSQKIEFISLENVFNVEDTGDSVEKHEAFSRIEKLIEDETDDWHFYDKKLFNIYRNNDLSMREIAEQTNISLTSIYHTLKKCKERIKENVGDDFEDYLNGDFELIK